MKRMVAVVFSLGALAGAVVFSGTAGGSMSESPTAAEVKRGGLLYDKWYTFSEGKPEGTHPAYPPIGKKKGASTWRCKECHGWDYLGKEGRYASGSHYTGIAGLLGVQKKTAEEVHGYLRNAGANHDFSRVLPEDDLQALVAFLRKGMVDVRTVIGGDGRVNGSVEAGRFLYEAQCAGCHGQNGDEIDFKPKKEGIQGIGWLARKNPQESLHKIRWGQPATKMPSMVVDAGLSNREITDLLAYTQSL